MKAVVLLSGGMDSTTALAHAIDQGYNIIVALNMFYGSMHNVEERAAAQRIVDYYGRPGRARSLTSLTLRNVNIPEIFRGGFSALLNEADMPRMSYDEIAESEGPSPTVVPFRNGVFVSMAAAMAAALDFDAVFVANHAEDARNWAYPDCTFEFMGAMASAVYVGTYNRVRLVNPFLWMTKGDVVARAAQLKAPLHLTYSCYEGGKVACGTCPTCIERVEAFKRNKYIDPILYRETANIEWPKECVEWPTK